MSSAAPVPVERSRSATDACAEAIGSMLETNLGALKSSSTRQSGSTAGSSRNSDTRVPALPCSVAFARGGFSVPWMRARATSSWNGHSAPRMYLNLNLPRFRLHLYATVRQRSPRGSRPLKHFGGREVGAECVLILSQEYSMCPRSSNAD